MGLAEGAACTIDGKAGTCHGPHPSRMYCTPGPAPNQGSASAVTGSGSAGSGSGSGAAGSAQPSAAGSAQPSTPSDPEPAPTPGHKRGCAVADPGGAALAGLAFAALVWRRRGGRRTMR